MWIARFAEEEKFARIAIRERAKKGRVDDGEDRGVGADAEGESEDDDGGKAGILAHEAEGVAQVLDEHGHLRAAGRTSAWVVVQDGSQDTVRASGWNNWV